MQLSGQHDQCILFAGVLLGRGQPVLVALAVLETQRILGRHVRADLDAGARIKEARQPLAGMDAHVMAALGADMQVALQFGAIQHGIAGRALDPQPFRNGAHAAFRLDPRRDDLFEPGHAYTIRSAGQPAAATMISESSGKPNTGG